MESGDILVVLIGLVLVVNGVFQLLRRFIFLKNRCTTQVFGTILTTERNEKEHSDSDRSNTVTYYLRYRYWVDGIEYVKKRTVSKRQLRVIGKHDNFTVYYDPSKPKRHYVFELKFRMLLMLTLIAIGAILLYYSFGNVILI